MELSDVFKKRRSVRAFQDKPVPQEKIKKILEAANSAPSAGNLQAYEIFLVKEKSVKKRLAEAALDQDFIARAPVVLVFFANPKKSAVRYGERGETLYSIQDATIAATFAWLSVVDQGLSTVWVGAFYDDKVVATLKADPSLIPVAILPVGFPAEAPVSPPRRSLSDLVHEV